MAKHKPRTGANRGHGILQNGHSRRESDPFVATSYRLIDAPAFKALSLAGRSILMLVMRRYRGDPAMNGQLPFSARDAEEWGIKHSVAAEALAELVELRFLTIAEESNLTGRRARRWACSEFPTVDGRGQQEPPSYAARRLSEDEAKAIAASMKAKRQAARQGRDPDSIARLKRDDRPRTRTALSADADTKRPIGVPSAVASPDADRKPDSNGALCPRTRTVYRYTMRAEGAAGVQPQSSPLSEPAHSLILLRERGWIDRLLAERLGVFGGTVKLWRSGARRPTPEHLSAIAELVATGEAPP